MFRHVWLTAGVSARARDPYKVSVLTAALPPSFVKRVECNSRHVVGMLSTASSPPGPSSSACCVPGEHRKGAEQAGGTGKAGAERPRPLPTAGRLVMVTEHPRCARHPTRLGAAGGPGCWAGAALACACAWGPGALLPSVCGPLPLGLPSGAAWTVLRGASLPPASGTRLVSCRRECSRLPAPGQRLPLHPSDGG